MSPSCSIPSSLQDKLGQLLLVGFRGSQPEDCAGIAAAVRAGQVGGVLLFDQEMAAPGRGRRNIESPAQIKALLAFLQAQAALPLLTAVDQEGGRVNRLKPDFGFPASISHQELGRIGSPEETYRRAADIAGVLGEAGFNLNLAPVVDLDANPDNPIIQGKGRSFSADPEAAARHAAAFIRAHRDRGVLTCAKHFPGHGSAAGDTHLGLVDVTATWDDRELIPFQRLIAAGLSDVIMTAHVFNRRLDPDRPATLSPAVIGGLLRGQLGYDGVVITDDLEMKAISDHYGLEESVPLAIEAGADLLCFGNNLNYDPDIAAKALAVLTRAVESGRLSESRIEDSCRRVLALKQRIVGSRTPRAP